jgi:hypothetical protein
MIRRIGFLAVAGFWLAMNVLLWRSELGGSGRGGSAVSTDVVLERLLTSPDPATLELQQHGKPAGYLHWYPDPGEDPNRVYSEDFVPEGMVRAPRSLQLRLEGNVSAPALGARLHLDCELQLSTNRVWESFSVQLGNRTDRLRIRASQSEQRLEWQITRDGLVIENQLDLREAGNPQKLLGDLAGPLAPLLAGPWAIPLTDTVDTARLIQWDARLDWMPLGQSRVRIYKLRARLADRYEAVLFVNRAGEILRIYLPGGWRLLNEGLATF